jgi:hypothetical protein
MFHEGIRNEAFRYVPSCELVNGHKYLLFIGRKRIKGTFVYSDFNWMQFDMGEIKTFPIRGSWIFEFIKVKKKIVEAMELRALTMILKNLINENFILN